MTIIDVRISGEYREGCVSGSINIPHHEIHLRIEKIKQLPQPVILCFASGNRSSQTTALLRSNGVACKNGGSWFEVSNKIEL